MAKRSNVYYIYSKESVFEPVKNAKRCNNSLGLDLFKYNGRVYEGRSGFSVLSEKELPHLDFKVKSEGGIERLKEIIERQIEKTGESPRYTQPEIRKEDLFPPDPMKENTFLLMDSYGKKRYYFRFYNEDGFELFCYKNDNDPNRMVFVQCEGYMLCLGGFYQLEDILTKLRGYKGGVRAEVERAFNRCMADPGIWADIGFARILGRIEEAEAHNAPIREQREREDEQREAERIAKRIADEQAEKEAYAETIKAAEDAIMDKKKVSNSDVSGKSLVMQLFREHKIEVPLKTQGWIINSLVDIFYNEEFCGWSYHYRGKNNSTVFRDFLQSLVAAVEAEQEPKE